MNKVLEEFLEASSFIQSMEMTFESQAMQLRALEADDLEDTLMDFFHTHRQEIINQAAMVVSSVFTELELQELTAFYRTSTGRMLVSKMPAMAAQVNVLLAEWVLKATLHVEEQIKIWDKKSHIAEQ